MEFWCCSSADSGMQGHPDRLKILWDNGARFIGTDSARPPRAVMPAPFVQPYWYEKEGFPELLENYDTIGLAQLHALSRWNTHFS